MFGSAAAPALPAHASPEKAQPTIKTSDLPIRIRLGSPVCGPHCSVHIGDTDVSSICRAVSVGAAVGELSVVRLELLAKGDSFIDVEPGRIDLDVADLRKRLRFQADRVRVKADL